MDDTIGRMTQLDPLPEPFFILKHTTEGYFTLTLHEGRVLARIHWPFDLDTDEFDDLSGSFSIEQYSAGIERLFAEGHSRINGEKCELLLERKDAGKFHMEFTRTDNVSWGARNVPVKVDQALEALLPPSYES
jgi:hypothetical protein